MQVNVSTSYSGSIFGDSLRNFKDPRNVGTSVCRWHKVLRQCLHSISASHMVIQVQFNARMKRWSYWSSWFSFKNNKWMQNGWQQVTRRFENAILAAVVGQFGPMRPCVLFLDDPSSLLDHRPRQHFSDNGFRLISNSLGMTMTNHRSSCYCCFLSNHQEDYPCPQTHW